MLRKIKLSFCIIILYVFTLPLFCIEKLDFTNSKNNLTLYNNFQIQHNTSVNQCYFGVEYLYDITNLTSNINLNICSNNFNFSNQNTYYPFSLNNYKFGVSNDFHIKRAFDIYTDYDFLIGPAVSLSNEYGFNFDAKIFYLLKYSNIDVLPKDIKAILNNDLAFDLNFNYIFENDVILGLQVSSYNKEQYNLFLSPIYDLYCSFLLTENICYKIDLGVKYIDMFTFSANLNQIFIKNYITFKL